jgi:hypothetical protein
MGKHRMISCEMCGKSIRSNAMARHVRGCSTIQVRAENGRFAGRAARPVKAAARPVQEAARSVQEAARPVQEAALPVAPLLVDEAARLEEIAALPVDAAPRLVMAAPSTRQPRSRSPSLLIAPLHHMSRLYLSQQGNVRASRRSQKRRKDILKKY